MTLDRIDLVGNGFHETPDAFIKSHTMERRGEPKARTLQKITFHTITHCLLNIAVSVLYIFHHKPKLFFFLISLQTTVTTNVNSECAESVQLQLSSQCWVSVTTRMKDEDVPRQELRSLRCRFQMNMQRAPSALPVGL